MGLGIIWESLPRFIDGTLITIQITGLSIAIGLCLAVPLALMRVARNPFVRVPVYAFIFYFRGTPLLVQIFLIYYGSGAAYTAEILRGAIQGVSWGEIEAARACGMSGALLYRRIILPKAFRLAWPAYTNEVVFLLQASSLQA